MQTQSMNLDTTQMTEIVEKRERGRPSLYRDEYVDELIQFFDIAVYSIKTTYDKEGSEKVEKVLNPFPTLARFATKVGVTRETLHEWATARLPNGELRYPDFAYAYKRAKDYQEALLVEGAIGGMYQANFSIFTAKNVLGWRDKTEQEITGKDGEPLLQGIQVTFVKPEN
jgi:hypothetical protein